MRLDYEALKGVLARAGEQIGRAPPGYHRNAVCLLLFECAGTRLVLIRKANTAGYPWRDHVALPGGRIDPSDASTQDAALRELNEELGIDPRQVEVLGTLGHFQTGNSDNDLEVIVARWAHRSEMNVDRREIATVLDVAFRDLTQHHQGLGFRGRSVPEIGDALVYNLATVKIWGVTARILHHFQELVLDRGLYIPD